MSVLIRDMEMPQNCSECAFCGYYGNKEHMCDIIEKAIEYENAKTNRRDDCPLIELPQHGRLIDADKITEHKYTTIPPHRKEYADGKPKSDEEIIAFKFGWNYAIDAIVENAPTIIPAEEPTHSNASNTLNALGKEGE